jgi:hypothetical protein
MKVLMLKRTSFASNDQILCFEFDFIIAKIQLDDFLKSVKINSWGVGQFNFDAKRLSTDNSSIDFGIPIAPVSAKSNSPFFVRNLAVISKIETPKRVSCGKFSINVPSSKITKTRQTTVAVCLLDGKSQRLHGVLREFLTSRSLRREHWPGGTEAARFLEPTRSILPSATEQYNGRRNSRSQKAESVRVCELLA